MRVVQATYDLDRPYHMVSGQQEQAEHIFERSADGRWFWAVNTEEPGALIYYDPRDEHSQGFGGAVLTFKLTDGTEVKVKGPWHSNSSALYTSTGIDLRNKHKTWGLVALQREYRPLPKNVSGNSSYYRFVDVLHLDTEPVVGAFNRIREIAQVAANEMDQPVFYYSESRGGSSCGPCIPSGWSRERETEWWKAASNQKETA